MLYDDIKKKKMKASVFASRAMLTTTIKKERKDRRVFLLAPIILRYAAM